MKILLSLLIIFIISNVSIIFSQNFSGQVVDSDSLNPVPYVNIGIIGKNIGTVSNLQGNFSIELSDNFFNDSLRISCIGYESRTYLISNLISEIDESSLWIVELKPKIYQLNEVVIKPVDTEIYNMGNFCEAGSAYGNSFPSDELGTEVGVRINFSDYAEKGYLRSFRFYIGKFTIDSITVRLNIYNLKNNLPHENILKQPIFVDLSSKGEYNIGLEDYYIMVTEDFFVSLEYYTISENTEGELVFCAVENFELYKGNGFYRMTSQGHWQLEIAANTGLSVEVECEED